MMKKKIVFVAIFVLVFYPNIFAQQKKAVNPDSQQDVAELKADAEKGDRGAQYELSMVYTYKKDAVAALSWLTKSAENGYGKAQYALGNLYYNGSAIVKRDYQKAVKWFEESKKTGYKITESESMINSAKLKVEAQKAALAAKKKAELARQKAAALAQKTVEVSSKTASKAVENVELTAKKAVEISTVAASSLVEKTAETTKPAVEETKSVFQRIKDKLYGFFN